MQILNPRQNRPLLDILFELVRALRIFQQEAEFCGGVTFAQFVILDLVDQAGGSLPLAELHGRLEVDKSTTTRLVKPLVSKGLVGRRRSRSDSRAVKLSLTPAGSDVLAQVHL